ncbi:endo-arabinase [Flavobacterium sp. XS2P24]|uniref:endo-arabinase n=1 Tax=Flavobacterium sp. XS2P24 TaxID=3041249 RepID=UPI0024A9484B|nr:endo-arabinase [Flavobacterium sp. XS2P24]MDI6050404.1 endo-arabinase [Flavobacterium sp. XS2P24]
MKWTASFFLILIINMASYSQKIDEAAVIKKLLEKESATWRAADSKGHTECWHIQPYSRILISTADGVTLDIPPTAMINTNPNAMGNGGFSVNTNYKMSINGNNAWVSHDEESTAKDGKKTFSYEIRLLEKIKGQWKLVGQSIHLYNPK